MNYQKSVLYDSEQETLKGIHTYSRVSKINLYHRISSIVIIYYVRDLVWVFPRIFPYMGLFVYHYVFYKYIHCGCCMLYHHEVQQKNSKTS